MTWRRKGPRHQQQWYLLCWTGLIRSPRFKGLSCLSRDRIQYIEGRRFHLHFFFQISKFVPKDVIGKSSLVQVMAWCRNRRQTIARANDDQESWRHMASLDHSELMWSLLFPDFVADLREDLTQILYRSRNKVRKTLHSALGRLLQNYSIASQVSTIR